MRLNAASRKPTKGKGRGSRNTERPAAERCAGMGSPRQDDSFHAPRSAGVAAKREKDARLAALPRSVRRDPAALEELLERVSGERMEGREGQRLLRREPGAGLALAQDDRALPGVDDVEGVAVACRCREHEFLELADEPGRARADAELLEELALQGGERRLAGLQVPARRIPEAGSQARARVA